MSPASRSPFLTRPRVRALLAALVVTVTAAAVVAPTAAAKDPTPAQVAASLMKRAVAVQGQFVTAAAAYEQAAAVAARQQAATRQAQADAVAAAKRGDAARAELGRYAADLYVSGGLSVDQPALALVALLTSEAPEDDLHGQAVAEYLGQQRAARVHDLLQVRDQARDAASKAARAHRDAQAAQRRAAAALDDIQDRADALAVEIDEALSKVGNTGGLVSAEQVAMNQAARDAWAAYTGSLAKAGITAPKASALANPKALPTGLSPLVGADGKPVPGVATKTVNGQPVKVLSAEAINAVTGALRQIGKPYVPNQSGPEAFDCGGLVSSMWGHAGVSFSPVVTTQWVIGARVPAGSAQPGDLVFLADPAAGVHHVGMVVAPSLMVSASSQTFMVGAQMIPQDVFGVIRPTLTARTVNALPPSAGEPMACGSSDDLPSLEDSAPDVTFASGAPLPSKKGRAWGGYANGMIPAGALCEIGGGAERLRCDAARAFNALDAAFRAKFGSPICINDGYRSYPDQIRVFRETPHLAAVPGTSNHGWGLATDLGCGINQFGTAPYAWMKANAPRFGFFHPAWAEPDGSKPEAWHWEFGRQP